MRSGPGPGRGFSFAWNARPANRVGSAPFSNSGLPPKEAQMMARALLPPWVIVSLVAIWLMVLAVYIVGA
jgi:hypothetical protein